MKSFALLILLALSLVGCSSLSKRTSRAPLVSGDFNVDLTVCKAKGESKKSLLILPPTGGTNTIDKSYLKTFCKNGFDVYLFNDWSRPGETGQDLFFHQRAYTNSQKAIGLVLEKIKTPFIGLLGTSVGATYAAVAANTFASLDAVFFIVGGVPIMEVVATSDHPSMLRFHESRFKTLGFKNDEEYFAALSKSYSFEPTKHPNLGKRIGVVIATKDKTVPTKTQQQLIDYFHPSKLISLSGGHVWAVVKTWLFHTDDLVSFFEESAASNEQVSQKDIVR
ncbi:MAG: hypothetical protein EOP05_08885 [Proteobacteria bacterium]|nr:MAG: hypothetical protein EOP05_08885 [Pseudomonadota bacterium]